VRPELATLALKGLLRDKSMAKIYERNPDTGEIRSRDVTEPTKAQKAISRSELLDEIWAANKHIVNGEWYVRLSDVCDILGEDYARKEQ
jgi:GH43 family beta-xylosidase